MLKALFGNATAKKVLLYLANYDEGYATGIARTFDLFPGQVYNQLVRLESGGILVSRSVGKTKLFSFNPRWAFRKPLLEILEGTLESLPPETVQKYYRERRRPRRTGKAL